MADYASKGVAGSGLGLGIAGTALGLLNGNGNGILGGILGTPNANARIAETQYVSELQAKIQGLEAQRYSDQSDKSVYQQTLSDNRNLRDEVYAFLTPLSNEAANNRVEIAKLQEQIKCCCEKAELREQIVLGKVNEVAIATSGQFNAINNTIACIQNSLGGITKTVVPNTAVCPGWGNVTITPAAATTA